MTKLCKDCKYSRLSLFERLLFMGKFRKCAHQALTRKANPNPYDLVNGASLERDDMYFCSVNRAFDFACGADGKYFEAR